MEILVEVLKISVPGLLVVWVVYLMLKKHSEQAPPTAPKENSKVRIELRLKAYERLTLFMERITPDKMIQRQLNGKMTSGQLQVKLLQTIRQEFEHNLTQQLYVSDESWQAVVLAKENIIQLINSSKNAVKDEATAIEYSGLIIEAYHKAEETAIENAIKLLKREVISLLS